LNWDQFAPLRQTGDPGRFGVKARPYLVSQLEKTQWRPQAKSASPHDRFRPAKVEPMKVWRCLKLLLDRALETLTVLSFTGMMAVVSVQVFSRFFLPQAPHWTEEAARIMFIYTGSFAAGLAVKRNAYVAVDTLFNHLPPNWRLRMACGTHLTTAAFMFLTAWLSVKFAQFGAIQLSSAMRIPMSYIFAAIFVMSFSVGLYSLVEVGKKMDLFGVSGDSQGDVK
jgi:TRAP-type C4-dicarboxylate transport system permease small subunit